MASPSVVSAALTSYNSGTIPATGAPDGVGADTADVTNNVGGSISGTDTAINAATLATVINGGTISGKINAATATVINGGTISGKITPPPPRDQWRHDLGH